MANTFNLGNGNWAQKTEKLLAYNAENNNYKPLPFDFDRGSTATRVNKDGLIETVGVDVPRIDYTGNSKGHLLLEPSRQNKITYSEDFSEWVATNILLTENTVKSPDGSITADKIAATTTTLQHRVNFTSSNSSGATTFSFFAKAAEYSSCWARIGSSNAYFDLESGSTADQAGITSRAEYYGNGWYRCIMTKESSGANEVCRINITTSYLDSSDFLGDDISGIYLWGAQHEEGSYATSYIPTSGQSGGVTRSAETCSGAGNSTVFNDSEGVLYAEIGALDDDGTGRNLGISDGTTSNRILVLYSPNTNELRLFLAGSGGSITVNYTLTEITEFIKVAIKYKAQDFSFYVNGFEIDTNTSNITFSGFNDLSFNNPFDGGTSPFYGKTKDVRYYNTALSDSELQALTS